MLLQRRAAAGELQLDPADAAGLARAAGQLLALLKGDPHARLLFGLEGMTPEATRTHLEAAVDLFLRGCGAGGAGPLP